MIFDAAALSLRNLFAPETRTVFWKTLGLTILVLIGLWFGLRETFMAFIMPLLQGFIPELPDWAGWLTFIFGILASIGLALGLVLRFVPEIAGRYEALKEAHAARGIPVKLSRMLGPLIISTLKDADRIAEAIDARGIRGQ